VAHPTLDDYSAMPLALFSSVRIRKDVVRNGVPGVMNAVAAAEPYSSSLPKARRRSSTVSVRSTPTALMGRIPQHGWSSTSKETCMGRPDDRRRRGLRRRSRIQLTPKATPFAEWSLEGSLAEREGFESSSNPLWTCTEFSKTSRWVLSIFPSKLHF
jgi:hypothetical protein